MTSHNPFHFRGPLKPEEMIGRDGEADELFSLLEGGHSARLVGPRRYGKTTLLRSVLDRGERAGMATALVDLEDVLTLGSIVVRIERAYSRSLKGKIRQTVDSLFRAWDLGLSLGAGGFALTLRQNPRADAESVLLRLLDLPAELHRKTGRRSLIVFDEIQDVLQVKGADGTLRSVIQHHRDEASYAFAGSAPGLMDQLFADPKRPLLDQAVPMTLPPLPKDAVAAYIADQFERTGRDAGAALSPLVEFTRGHPQRSMLLAHYLWRRTDPRRAADEATWVATMDAALADQEPLLEATWKAQLPNERRVALALAASGDSLYEARTLAAVGISKGSVTSALNQLRAKGDVFDREPGRPLLTDPLLEAWLERRERA